MTVCIGILCEGNKKAVVVSDRMVTSGLMVEFEHISSKLDIVGNKTVTMTSGDALLWSSLKRRYRKFLDGLNEELKPKTVAVIAETVQDCYQTDRLEGINDSVFKKLGLNVEKMEEYASEAKGLQAGVINYLMGAIDRYEYDLNVMIVGLDDNPDDDIPGHIFQIAPHGILSCHDRIGHCVIGSGFPLASTTLMVETVHAGLCIGDAVYYALLAKKTAEKAPGVGSETEFAIMDENGVRRIEGEQLAVLYGRIQVQALSSAQERLEVNRLFTEVYSNAQ